MPHVVLFTPMANTGVSSVVVLSLAELWLGRLELISYLYFGAIVNHFHCSGSWSDASWWFIAGSFAFKHCFLFEACRCPAASFLVHKLWSSHWTCGVTWWLISLVARGAACAERSPQRPHKCHSWNFCHLVNLKFVLLWQWMMLKPWYLCY